MIGKFDGIAEQIGQHLSQSHRIANQGAGHRHRYVIQHLDALFGGIFHLHIIEIPQHLFQGEGRLFQLQLARLHLGEIQNIVDDAQQVCGRGGDLREIILLLRGQIGLHGQIAHADDAVHGGADFMAHIGDEFRFEATGLLQLVGIGIQLLGLGLQGFFLTDVLGLELLFAALIAKQVFQADAEQRQQFIQQLAFHGRQLAKGGQLHHA